MSLSCSDRPHPRRSLPRFSLHLVCVALLLPASSSLKAQSTTSTEPDLELEVTETALMDNVEHAQALLQEFRKLGKRALKTGKLDKVLDRLRTDPKLYFETAEEV